CQPNATSWRNIVTTVLGVVVVYHSDRSYWWSGVTFGAQDGFSSIIALRSPPLIAVTVTCMALVPPWALGVTVNWKLLSPQPDGSQQSGNPLSSRTSRPGLATRLASAKAGRPSSARMLTAVSATASTAARRCSRNHAMVFMPAL